MKPLVILFMLPKERNTHYVARTVRSLVRNNYEFVVTDSVDAHALGFERIRSLPWLRGINFDVQGLGNSNRSQHGHFGVWASHLAAWDRASGLGRSIISLETDTEAVSEWNTTYNEWVKYDLVFTHDHAHIPQRCDRKSAPMREGLQYWYACGALLFTGRNGGRPVWNALRRTPIRQPLGHWINTMWRTKRLRVGGMCPGKFFQHLDHQSTICCR